MNNYTFYYKTFIYPKRKNNRQQPFAIFMIMSVTLWQKSHKSFQIFQNWLFDLCWFEGKKCFTLCTSGSASEKYPLYLKETIEKKGGKFLRGFGCQGKSNYFPLNIFGGLHSDKPNENDINNAVNFVKTLVEENQ